MYDAVDVAWQIADVGCLSAAAVVDLGSPDDQSPRDFRFETDVPYGLACYEGSVHRTHKLTWSADDDGKNSSLRYEVGIC